MALFKNLLLFTVQEFKQEGFNSGTKDGCGEVLIKIPIGIANYFGENLMHIEPSCTTTIKHCCVAHLYCLINIQLQMNFEATNIIRQIEQIG